ncbi:hypothetical protein EB796_021400 [Bugula neritina]|uniref:Uncharacterized protein n=1 Tax=Bugula neritina TaxID=10212 RepID=A0A7J7J3M1_BUGNE|nr:hypothetical protein EB796_021400 [Bugula neritina]
MADVEAITADKLNVGRYVLAALRGKKNLRHFPGVVHSIQRDEDTAVISFYKSVGNRPFIVPVQEDVATVDICDLVLLLPTPTSSGGTERTCKKLTFNIDLSQYMQD